MLDLFRKNSKKKKCNYCEDKFLTEKMARVCSELSTSHIMVYYCEDCWPENKEKYSYFEIESEPKTRTP